jgi:2-polyprenyl-6-hydroxyphenyl methylase/3-demethylubiquinone-9 3-methyltransferase
MTSHGLEVERGDRFRFGDNWARFLSLVDEPRIAGAVQSLKSMLGVDSLVGKRFLDAGSGSGLFSLAARRLGAEVLSFDFDPQSVACTRELRERYSADDPHWTVETGSVLDNRYLADKGRFDVVYSWGVLHHTGSMWSGIDNLIPLAAPDGQVFIAIYNDQGWVTSYWRVVKRMYCSGFLGRMLVLALHVPYFLLRVVVRWLSGRGRLERGMSMWHDLVDWVGGYPFEVAKPEAIVRHFSSWRFFLSNITTCGGRNGCNEFVFRRFD